jgi:Fe-S-cluster containining protein
MDDFLERMRTLYERMSAAYDTVASRYGLSCEGCAENCCTQRFHHHTLAEYYYLREGVMEADPDLVRQMLMRAHVVVDSYRREMEAGEMLPLMCPANFTGKCTLYEHRPMICRLHGLPHRFVKPDGAEVTGGGCHRFESECGGPEERVDRTPFYTELAHIERDLRVALKRRGRYRRTTAEMLLDMMAEEQSLALLLEGD